MSTTLCLRDCFWEINTCSDWSYLAVLLNFSDHNFPSCIPFPVQSALTYCLRKRNYKTRLPLTCNTLTGAYWITSGMIFSLYNILLKITGLNSLSFDIATCNCKLSKTIENVSNIVSKFSVRWVGFDLWFHRYLLASAQIKEEIFKIEMHDKS